MPAMLGSKWRDWLLGGFRSTASRDECITFVGELATAGAGLQAEAAESGGLAVWFRGTTPAFEESIADAVRLYNGIMIDGVKRPG
jgi:hypothetical protein